MQLGLFDDAENTADPKAEDKVTYESVSYAHKKRARITLFRVEIEFRPDLEDVAKYCEAVDTIFAERKMPCIYSGDRERVYSDNGSPKDFGTLYACVSKIKRTPWIVKGIRDAHFDNGMNRDTLMTNFFKAALL